MRLILGNHWSKLEAYRGIEHDRLTRGRELSSRSVYSEDHYAISGFISYQNECSGRVHSNAARLNASSGGLLHLSDIPAWIYGEYSNRVRSARAFLMSASIGLV